MPFPLSIVEIVLVRHGPAGDPDPRRWPDDTKRPLTSLGRELSRQAGQGLLVLVPRAFQVISSPATRARTTAEIFQDELKVSAPLLIWDELGPGASAEESFRRWPELVDLGRPWVMVGHEPTLSELAGFAISGQSESIVRIGRAGAALLVFDGPTRPGGARLGWLLTAEQLSVFRNAPLLEPESR